MSICKIGWSSNQGHSKRVHIRFQKKHPQLIYRYMYTYVISIFWERGKTREFLQFGWEPNQKLWGRLIQISPLLFQMVCPNPMATQYLEKLWQIPYMLPPVELQHNHKSGISKFQKVFSRLFCNSNWLFIDICYSCDTNVHKRFVSLSVSPGVALMKGQAEVVLPNGAGVGCFSPREPES